MLVYIICHSSSVNFVFSHISFTLFYFTLSFVFSTFLYSLPLYPSSSILRFFFICVLFNIHSSILFLPFSPLTSFCSPTPPPPSLILGFNRSSSILSPSFHLLFNILAMHRSLLSPAFSFSCNLTSFFCPCFSSPHLLSPLFLSD